MLVRRWAQESRQSWPEWRAEVGRANKVRGRSAKEECDRWSRPADNWF